MNEGEVKEVEQREMECGFKSQWPLERAPLFSLFTSRPSGIDTLDIMKGSGLRGEQYKVFNLGHQVVWVGELVEERRLVTARTCKKHHVDHMEMHDVNNV